MLIRNAEQPIQHSHQGWRKVLGILGLVLILAGFVGEGAHAQTQVLDYQNLFGNSEQSEPQQSRPATPLPGTGTQSGSTLPSSPAAPASPAPEGPSIDDYARVADQAPDTAAAQARQAVRLFRERIRSIVQRLPQAWIDIKTTLAAASPTGQGSYFIGVAVFAALLIVIGRALAVLFGFYIARPLMVAAQRPNPVGFYGKMPVLFYRLLLTVVAVALTMITAATVGIFFYQDHEATETTVVVVFSVYAATLILDTLWRVIIAPYLSEYRIPVMDDAAARRLYTWLSAATSFGVISLGFTYWMRALGLSSEMHTAITVLLTLITVAILIVMLRVHRQTIAGVILGGRTRAEASWLSLLAVAVWAPAISLYLIFTWGDLSFRLIMGVPTEPIRLVAPYAIFMGGLLVYAVAAYLIERLFSRQRRIDEMNRAAEEARQREEEAADEALKQEIMARAGDAADVDGDGDEEGGGGAVDKPAPRPAISRSGMRTMEDLARRVASLFAIGAVAWGMARFWGGPDVFERIPGLGMAENLIDTLFLGYIVYHAVRIWIDQKIEEEIGDQPDDALPMEGEGGGAGATRLATLLPLLRNAVLILIMVSISLLAAMELGVNVAPLFAGAGIIGLAIGFGSQALVRDILSGAFFLIDDAFRKGEYIDVGDVKGTVEKIVV